MHKSINTVDPQKQEIIKKRHFAFRLNIFFFCTFALFSVLIVRLAFLQFVEGDKFRAEESENITISNPIAPIRGNIYDRDSYPIAYTTSTQSLFYRIEPGQDPDNVIHLAKQLAEIFKNYGDKSKQPLTPEDIIKAMDVGYDIHQTPTKEPSYYSSPRRIKEGLSNAEIAYIMENRNQFKGLEITEESVRHYDASRIAVQLVGYLRPYSVVSNQSNAGYLNYYKSNGDEYLLDEYVGLDGLEFLYQDELRGKNGAKIYPVNASNKIVGPMTIEKPVKGNNLILSIQKDVQLAAQQAITDHLKFMNSPEASAYRTTYYLGRNAVAGYAVAMEVDTGQVVAMASMPDYDPNVWRGGISTEKYTEIQQKYTNGTIRERAPDLPPDEIGRHPTSLVPPGSTLKSLTVLTGLDTGIITPNERFSDGGIFYFGRNNNASVRNSDSHAYGSLNATDAIRVSSNTYMSAMVGNRLYMSSKFKDPISVWDKYMKNFGLGVSTGSGLPGEYEGDIYYLNREKTGDSVQSALIYSSFGQGARYTTLQLAQYAATLASHGKRLKPQFVKEIRDFDNHVVKTIKPVVLSQVRIPDKYWDTVEKGMAQVRVGGFDDFKYDFYRKTGTSQSDIAGSKLENAVFIAYAPADHPKLAVAVVVPEGGYGAWGAAPIARKIFDAYDKYIGLTDQAVKNLDGDR